jgi:hypothetical protein
LFFLSAEALGADTKSVTIVTVLTELLIYLLRAHEAVELLESLVERDSERDPSFVVQVSAVATRLSAAGYGEEALRIIESSATAPRLEPLIVGLKKYLGLETQAPHEIDEVANDIVSNIHEIEAALAGRSQALKRRRPKA